MNNQRFFPKLSDFVNPTALPDELGVVKEFIADLISDVFVAEYGNDNEGL